MASVHIVCGHRVGRFTDVGAGRGQRVADVVEKNRRAQQSQQSRRFGGGEGEGALETFPHAGGHRQRPHAVQKATVGRTGIGVVGKTQLLDASKPLHSGVFEQAQFSAFEFDAAVQRIANGKSFSLQAAHRSSYSSVMH